MDLQRYDIIKARIKYEGEGSVRYDNYSDALDL